MSLNKSEYLFDHYIQNFTIKGTQVLGCCPFHDDHSPSFSGNMQTGLWHCFVGCGSGNWQQFMSRLGHTENTDFYKKTRIREKIKSEYTTEATYYYQDISGNTVLKIIRKKCLSTNKKTFHQFTKQSNGWVPKGFVGDLVPYRYTDWFSKNFVLLVEGEKVADYLLNLEIPATTTPGGANNWKPRFAQFFKNMTVMILPDHDPPGLIYAQSAFLDVNKFAKKTKIVKLPNLQEKEDAFDWFEKRGGSKPLLKQILRKELQHEE